MCVREGDAIVAMGLFISFFGEGFSGDLGIVMSDYNNSG